MRKFVVLLAVMLAPMQDRLVAQKAPPNSIEWQEIKGSEHPELIPEDDAIGALFQFLSDSPGAPAWADRAGFLKPSGLQDDQITAVIYASNKYRTSMVAFSAKINEIKSRGPRPLNAEGNAQITEAVRKGKAERTEIIAALKSDLGVEGTRKFLDFVEKKWKPNMSYHPGQ